MDSSRTPCPAFCSRLKATRVFKLPDPSNSTSSTNSAEKTQRRPGWHLDILLKRCVSRGCSLLPTLAERGCLGNTQRGCLGWERSPCAPHLVYQQDAASPARGHPRLTRLPVERPQAASRALPARFGEGAEQGPSWNKTHP